jgi:hypothetical protein
MGNTSTNRQYFGTLKWAIRLWHHSDNSASVTRSGRMTDPEIHAVWLYLKSVPARKFGKR